MVRLIAFLIGLFMSGWLLVSAGITTYGMITDPAKETVEAKFHKHPKHVSFKHDGLFGKYDKQQLQRGFKVFTEVCSACHSAKLVSFRDLSALGYSEDEVKAIAKGWKTEVPSINPDTGEAATRPGIAADKIPSPYANDTAARAANNNALPPDLSLITKARHNGPAYVYSLLTGYQPVPANLPKENRPGTGLHYNPYFANLNLAMAEPLTADGQVTYDDGTKATKDQMAKDVAAFLTWTAEPKMNARKAAGWVSLIFLLIFTGLTYLSYRTIWADKKKH
ncbi:cytochrome c1 [Sphingorhabdus sp.]|jgi:ubiquinol-cytochrome c reductase cytochrome c1 subunit|uniref:cytochrome c1 n=1 Tax=Sphingorhabdus sp. TaxID=1902408 RepID=UPI003BB21412|nr:cytochrome c1 [Sphingomonadales bacterium]MBK9433152.1 cytochrome c1 [Sphingomonadales bacterium]MBL0021638.1 cytochrome c1 [Sphingomonadales bacterium]